MSERERKKPACKLTGVDGNVFNVIGKVRKTLQLAGEDELAKQFCTRAFEAKSYEEVLKLCFEFVEVR
jgi:hypothetical protein